MSAKVGFHFTNDENYVRRYHDDLAETAMWILPELRMEDYRNLAEQHYFSIAFENCLSVPTGVHFREFDTDFLNAFYHALARSLKNYFKKKSLSRGGFDSSVGGCCLSWLLLRSLEKEPRIKEIDTEAVALRQLLETGTFYKSDEEYKRLQTEAYLDERVGVLWDGGFKPLPGDYPDGPRYWERPDVKAFNMLLYLTEAIWPIGPAFNADLFDMTVQHKRRIDLRGLSPEVISAFIENVNRADLLAQKTVFTYTGRGYEFLDKHIGEVKVVWKVWVDLLNSVCVQSTGDSSENDRDKR